MICTELNPVGNFDPWIPAKLQELKEDDLCETLGQKLLFENETIKVWEIVLFPGERLPFRRIKSSYSFTAITEGLAISRCVSGRIDLIRMNSGDSTFKQLEIDTSICDLENIGDTTLILNALEFL